MLTTTGSPLSRATHIIPLPMTTYQQTEPVRFSSRAEAEAWAAGWLRNLETESDYEWEWEPHGSVACELAPGVPARVVGMAASVGEEWAPSAIFTVGVKYEGRYWQGRVGEWDRPGTLSGAALLVLDAILKVLASAARTSLPAPTTVSV